VTDYAQGILDFMYKDSTIHLDRKYKLYQQSNQWKRQFPLKENSMIFKLNGYPKSYEYRRLNESCCTV